MAGCCLGKIDSQPGIIELAVMIEDTSPQTFSVEGGGLLQGLLTAQPLGFTQSQLARHPVIYFEAKAVIGAFPPLIVGYNKGLVLYQVRCIPSEDTPFMQCLCHQFDIALL